MRLSLLGLLSAVLFSSFAMALDTDGDGIDDAIDVFPNDACAAADTDTDGYPDALLPCSPVLLATDSFENGNFNTLSWTTGGNANWVVQSSDVHDGSQAAKSGVLLSGQTSWLELTYTSTEPLQVSFWGKAQLNFFSSTAYFYVDGVRASSWTSLGTWTEKTIEVSAGTHTYRWQVTRNGSQTAYAWIDHLRISAISALVADNCPIHTNVDQLDTDGDGMGNACDNESVENDFGADHIADILLRSTSGGNWRLFTLSGGISTANSAYSAYTSADWQLVASEDFDADGDTDILLRNSSSGAWRMFITENGAVQSDANFGAYANTAWEVASVADYNGDGTKDILLHSNGGGGWRVFYISNGATTSNANMALYATGWDLKYDGDIDGDGDADIILRRASDGYWRQFTVAGGVVASNSATGLYQSLDWQIQFASDLDNDGDDDIVMRNMVSGFNWRTFNVASGSVGSNSKLAMYENANWSFNHLNDVDADGDDDIVLRSNTGGWRLFLTDGLNTPANSALGLYASSAWVKADVVDVDGDGTKDVILNNTSSGAWRAFMISGGVISSDTNPGLYQNVDWTLQNK